MVFGHAEGLHGRDENPAQAAQLERDCFGGECIGADGSCGAMLLSGPQGNNDSLAVLQILINIRPALQSEANGIFAGGRAGEDRRHAERGVGVMSDRESWLQ